MLKKTVARILEIKASAIALLTDTGLITPGVANPEGKGTSRRYSARNLVEFLLVKKMLASGLTHRQIKQIMPWLNDVCESPGPNITAEEFSKARLGLGWDALNIYEPLNLSRYTFLIIYNDEQGMNFDLIWRENKTDTAELPVNMQLFETAKVISLRPLLDRVRELLSKYYGDTNKV